MGSNAKSVRDMLLTGGPGSVISTLLASEYHVPAMTAVVIGMAFSFAAPRAYRLLRARWPWLAAFDPSAS